MYLVYIYNSFIFNLFFTFLLFWHLFIRFKLGHGHLFGRIKELYMSGKTCWRHADLDMPKRQIWQNSSENLYWLIWYILYLYMLFFRFDASTKKLFVSFHICFSCLADGVLVQVNTFPATPLWKLNSCLHILKILSVVWMKNKL